MSKKVRVSDIAERAGVSPATVSRVINHPELVKQTTVKYVQSAMAVLGVDIKKTSKLVLPKKDLLILNVPDIKNEFYDDIMAGAEAAARAHNCNLIITQYPLRKGSISEFLDFIKVINAAGVILLSKLEKVVLDEISAAVKIVQCCEYNQESGYPYISINNYSSAKAATKYLINSGRKKIAFINGPLTYHYSMERQRGFIDAMSESDLTVKANWVVNVPKVDFNIAYATVCQILDSSILPNAIFTSSDILAVAAIKAAHHFKIRVPHDIAVVGFDNIPFSSMCTPSITTVSQPRNQLGYAACEMLIENIIDEGTASNAILLNTEFIVRGSTV